MNIAEIEKRLAAVERKIGRLETAMSGLSGGPGINAWIDQIHGTFEDDASYRQAACLCRKWRKSQIERRRRGGKRITT